MRKIHTTVYRDHELVVRHEPRGWRGSIAESGRTTRLHPHPFAAFAEARRLVDKIMNHDARPSLWAGRGLGPRGLGGLRELRRLPEWFRATILS